MLPTLNGRIQTRIFALLVFGGLWTSIVTPALPTGAPLDSSYKTTFVVLSAITVLGIGWEIVYHGLQQFRWEKDWPTFFGLITAINEGILLWILLAAGALPGNLTADGPSFCIHFISTWLIVWLITNGPMRVPFIRWRFNGGRLV